MEQDKNMKICKRCKRFFKPQFSLEDLKHLYFSEEEIERREFLEKEYPDFRGFMGIEEQQFCGGCISEKRKPEDEKKQLEINRGLQDLFGKPIVIKINKKKRPWWAFWRRK